MALKTSIIGLFLSVAAGGGIYGLYINYGTRAVLTQVDATELIQQCAILQTKVYPNPAEINDWLTAAKAIRPKIFAVNAIVGSVIDSHESGSTIAKDTDDTLRNCAETLKMKLQQT